MFNLKRSAAEQSSLNVGANNALPNNYGDIRTLKRDFEDFKSGKSGDDFASPLAAESAPPTQKTSQPETIPGPQPAAQVPSPLQNEPLEQKTFTSNIPIRKTAPSEMPAPPQTSLKKNQEKSGTPGIPNPFGSDSFYQEQPPFENVGEELNKQAKASSLKSSGRLGAILAVILILLVAGGGVYYWWFYLRSQNTATNNTSQKTSSPSIPAAATNTSAGLAKDAKFKQWTIDLTSDKIATKLAIKRYISDFVSAASENDIIEAKLLSSDGQPIEPSKFEDLFGFQLPASISGNVSNEYSIFVKKENSLARMGAAFKLSQATGISESLRSEEPSLAKNLMSFYLDVALSDSLQAFNSGKYKSADIRYFNFASPPDTSLDYTIISGQENNYFIFATSKDTMHSILDYMSEK